MKVKLITDAGYQDCDIVGHVYEAVLQPWGVSILGSLLSEHSTDTSWCSDAGYAFKHDSYEVVEEKHEKPTKKSKR